MVLLTSVRSWGPHWNAILNNVNLQQIAFRLKTASRMCCVNTHSCKYNPSRNYLYRVKILVLNVSNLFRETKHLHSCVRIAHASRNFKTEMQSAAQRISLAFEFCVARIVDVPGFESQGTCAIRNTKIRTEEKSENHAISYRVVSRDVNDVATRNSHWLSQRGKRSHVRKILPDKILVVYHKLQKNIILHDEELSTVYSS